MTEHTEPRKWTLRVTRVHEDPWWKLIGFAPREAEDDGADIAVREDTATEADVEAVARWLIEDENRAEGERWVEDDAPELEGARNDARSLLSTIFKDAS